MFNAAHSFDISIPPAVLVETENEARQWLAYFDQSRHANGNALGLDSETTGLAIHRDIVLVWSLSDGRQRICLDAKFLELFKPLLENPSVNLDLTNAKFDAHMFANTGLDISKAGEWRDTSHMSWLWNENRMGRHGLKECTSDFIGRRTPEFTEVFGKIPVPKKGEVKKTPGDLIRVAMADPVRRFAASDYASLDAYNSTCLRAIFDEKLERELLPAGSPWGNNLREYFYRFEVPFTKVLWKMERRGIVVDKGYLESLDLPMRREMEEIEKAFAKAAGKVINLNSPIQLREFFYGTLKKAVTRMTDGGTTGNKQPSTDSDTLDEWAGQGCEHSQLLLRHRAISKIHGTYVKGLQEWIDQRLRIHSTLNQHGAVTGRLSSRDPNLQNIPRASEDRFKIREAFTHGPHKKLVVADYEQLEMRVMAHFSRDQKMIQAIIDGTDLHCLTVAEMYGIPYDDVKAAKKAESQYKEGKRGPLTDREEELLIYRQAAKATGFGIIYGIGGPGLAAQLTKATKKLVTPEEGTRLIDKWLNVFPGVRRYMEESKRAIRTEGCVRTVTDRPRRFGDVRSMSRSDQAQSERQAGNARIQGTAADMAKMAMLIAEYDPVLHSLGAELLLQVHDELIWECPDDDAVVEQVKKRVQEIMSRPLGFDLAVPTPASAGAGHTWADAK